MLDTTKDITLTASPTRARMIAFSLFFSAAVSVAFAWPLFAGIQPHPLGWVGAAFFAAGGVYSYVRAVGQHRPELTLSPKGFRFRPVSLDFIPWTAVTGVRQWNNRRSNVLIVEVTEDIWQNANLTRTTRWARPAYKANGLDGLAIPDTGMPVPFNALAQGVMDYALANGAKLRKS